MAHSDDDGLICPPRVAPAHVVILPIAFRAENPAEVHAYCDRLADELRAQSYAGHPVEVELDRRDLGGGEKVWSWIKKGVPVRVEVGPRDIAQDSVFVGRRDQPHKDKRSVGRAEFVATIGDTLTDIQSTLLERARAFREEHTRVIDDKQEFLRFFSPPDGQGSGPTPIHGGFALAHFCGDPELEEHIKKEHGVTVRCLLGPGQHAASEGSGTCILSGKPSARRVLWAKAY
jgi:prolyl-tRNA synthetase